MTGKTHIAAGFAVGGAYAYLTGADAPMVLASVAAASALVPDIDLCTSKLGRKIRPVSMLIQALFGHRTLFHAPVLYVALWVTLSLSAPEYGSVITAGAIGAFSHVLLDCMNSAGVPLLYPLRKRFHVAKVKSRGVVEFILFAGLLLIDFYLAISLYGQ